MLELKDSMQSVLENVKEFSATATPGKLDFANASKQVVCRRAG